MLNRIRILALLATLLILPGCIITNSVLGAHERFYKAVALNRDGAFFLENVNGSVIVEAGADNEVQIEAEKTASSQSYLERIEIEVRGQGDRVDVRTRMPRGGFLFGGHGNVEYRIRLPREAAAELKTVNGTVRVEAIAGRLRASTVNGSVKLSDAEGAVTASTVNGSITAGYRKPVEGRHEFSTVNGSITLYLPSDAGGDFAAHTVNGGISTDFPLTVSGRIGGHSLRGRLGDGRGEFHIRTVNGGVKLLKGQDKVVRRNLLESSYSLCVTTRRNLKSVKWS